MYEVADGVQLANIYVRLLFEALTKRLASIVARRPSRSPGLLQRREGERRLVHRRGCGGGLLLEAEDGLSQVEQVGLAVLLVAGGVHHEVEARDTRGSARFRASKVVWSPWLRESLTPFGRREFTQPRS